ncbi:MAG: HrpE/YscL family type III secretion apparatus protein [Chlamydiae bacterium]|jgi:type III secretion protein L|nr:HrpE/YscL family type III secretion apparatus protein [Chlamydiota bacterium]
MKFFSLIYQGDIHPSDNKKVIPANTYSTLVDAHQVLERAKEDASNYKKSVEEECEVLRENAKKEGFQEGLEKFHEHVIAFDGYLKEIRHEMHKQILTLALQTAKKIVAKELEQSPETIVDIVLQALQPVTQSHRIVIYVNKADRDILEKNKPKIKDIFEKVETLSIQERPDIQVGGCIIETESGIINAEIENQWRALEAAFDRYMKQKPR